MDEKAVVDKLFDFDNLIIATYDEERKTYKLVYHLSSKYNLVIVVADKKRFLAMVTAYKTDKKLQRLIGKSNVVYYITRFHRY